MKAAIIGAGAPGFAAEIAADADLDPSRGAASLWAAGAGA
jgi:hypothetical protein